MDIVDNLLAIRTLDYVPKTRPRINSKLEMALSSGADRFDMKVMIPPALPSKNEAWIQKSLLASLRFSELEANFPWNRHFRLKPEMLSLHQYLISDS